MSQVLEQAKQGSVPAIATLLNRSLKAQGIKVKVMRQAQTLKVLLESLSTPDQAQYSLYIIQGLQHLNITDQVVEIYGKRSGGQGFAWIEKFQATPAGLIAQSAATDASAPTNPAAHTAENSSDTQSVDRAVNQPRSATTTTAAPTAAVSSSAADLSNCDTDTLAENAKAGDRAAITAFVKAALADREGLEVFVDVQGTTLKVTIQTKEFLDGPAFCGKLGNKLAAIASENLTEVEFHKRKGENAMAFMMKQATIWHGATTTSPELATPSDNKSNSVKPHPSGVSQMRPNGQSSAMSGYQGSAIKSPEAAAKPTKIDPAQVIAAIIILIAFIGFAVWYVPKLIFRMGIFGYFALIMAIVPAIKFYRFWKPMINLVLTGK